MYEIPDIHLSLDDARAELKRRWGNVELRREIQDELGTNFMPAFSQAPRGVSFRQLCPPDNGFTFFFQCANYLNAIPLVLEYHGDKFVSFNEEKKGLGRLRVVLEDGTRARVDIMEFHKYEMKRLSDIALKTGESLVEFHHRLFDVSGYRVELHDNTAWFAGFGRASSYYYDYLLHFVAHGVWFENIEPYNEDGSPSDFILNVTHPAIRKIEERFGLRPLVVRLYPLHQTDEEDFYWWRYPPQVNDYIINYAKTHSLPLRNVIFK